MIIILGIINLIFGLVCLFNDGFNTMNTEIHKELTGSGNEQILENIKHISEYGTSITIRTPVIPGLNSSKENIIETAKFICTLPSVKEYELLPYHQYGVNKYKALGRTYELDGVEPPDDFTMSELVGCANKVFEGTDKTCYYTKENKKIIVK